MKFRLAAAIALFFLWTLLFSTLSTYSSREKPRITQTSLLPQRKNNILSLVINKFLTCKDIIVLRQTCYDFQDLLHPNDAHMVTFCIYGFFKTMTDTNIIWEDLKYFMKQSYYSAFYEIKMFNIKQFINNFQYAVLTHVPEEKYIVWNNPSIHYNTMLLEKTTLFTPLPNYHEKHFEPITITNKAGNAWAKITNEGNDIITQKFTNEEIAILATMDENEVYESIRALHKERIKSTLTQPTMSKSQQNHILTIGTSTRKHTIMQYLTLRDIIPFGETCKTLYEEVFGFEVKEGIRTLSRFCTMNIPARIVPYLNKSVLYFSTNQLSEIPDEILIQLVNVQMISSTNHAFAALLDNGNVVAWGHQNSGGNIPRKIQNKMIKNVKMIFSTNFAFAALLNDGSVVAWGHENSGGKIPDDIQIQLIDIKQIIPTQTNFTALCKNSKILTWGYN